METIGTNQAFLQGRAVGTAQPSHANHGVTYFVFPLEVERLSGAVDTLNIVCSEQLRAACPVVPGEHYRAAGEIRSFNNRSGVGSRLVITFFAKSLEAGEESGFSGENYFSNVFKRHYIFSTTSTKNSLLLLENFAIPPYFSETAEMEARPMPFRLWPVE